jgi:hypothetical protein
MTSSASASSLSGMLRPSALAVFILITNSNRAGLLDRQIGGLGAFEDLAGVDTDLAIAIADADAVAHEPAGSDVIAELIHRRQLELRRQRHDPFAPRIEEGVGGDEQCGDSSS